MRRFFPRFLPYYNPDTGNNPQGGVSPNPDPQQGFQNLLARHQNDAIRLAETLYRENHDYREQNRTLQGQLPAQGAVVLTPDQATQWQAYQQLGDVPTLQTALTERQTATTELATLKRDKSIQDVAGAAGYKASVLSTLASDRLAFSVRDVDGKKVGFVKDGETESILTDYAKTHWADFLPSLQVAAQPAGTTFISQHGGGTPPPQDLGQRLAAQFQAERDAAPNPLAPKASA